MEREAQRKATEAAEHERIMRERFYTLTAPMMSTPSPMMPAPSPMMPAPSPMMPTSAPMMPAPLPMMPTPSAMEATKTKGKRKRNRKAISSDESSEGGDSDVENSDEDTSEQSDGDDSDEPDGRKKKRRSGNKKHIIKTKQKGKSSQQLETEYYEKIVRMPDLAHSKSAEMRKWLLHVWAMAKLFEKEERKKEKGDFRAAGYLCKRMGEEIIASLDEFWKQPPSMDTSTKIDRIVSRVADFCNKHNSQIGTRAREWLPVPGAGSTSFKSQGMTQQNTNMMPQQTGQTATTSNTNYKPYWKQGFKSAMQEKNEQPQPTPTQSPEQMAKEMKEAILKEMTQTLTQQFSQQQAAINSQNMQPMQYRAPQTNFFPNANMQQLPAASTPMQQQQQQAAAQLPMMNHQRMPMICFICQQPGHRQIHCPQMASARAAMAASSTTTPAATQGATTTSVSRTQTMMRMMKDASASASDGTGKKTLVGCNPRTQVDGSNSQNRPHATKAHESNTPAINAIIGQESQGSHTQAKAMKESEVAAEADIILDYTPFMSASNCRALGEGADITSYREVSCDCRDAGCGACQFKIDAMPKDKKEFKGIPSKENEGQAMQARAIHDRHAPALEQLSHLETNANNEYEKAWIEYMENLKTDTGEWERENEDDDEEEVNTQREAVGEGGPPESTQRLRDFMKATPHGKKMFDKNDLSRTCTFCKRKGHTRASCICTPPLTPWEMGSRQQTELQKRKEMFVMGLVYTPNPRRTDSQDIEKEPRRRVEIVKEAMRLGAIANANNPWKESTKRRDMLRKQLGYWWAIGADPVVLGWIGFGVRLRFESEPPRTAFGNHRSYEVEKDHIDEEHAKHVKDGSFRIGQGTEVHACNPLQVEVNAKGKRRQCLDMRYPNAFLADYTFTQETLQKHVATIVEKNDWLITTDVEKAYYQVPLHKESQKYCTWRHKGQWVIPTILVFGLSVAPFIFTKIMRVILKYMRSLGIRGTNCIDDNLWAAPTKVMPEVKEIVQLVFGSLGWVFNAKCEWDSETQVVYNGMWIDSRRFEIRATEEKIELSRKLAWTLWYAAQRGEQVMLKDLQKLAGRLQSMRLALEGVAPWTRGLYGVIARTMEQHNQRPPKNCMVWLDQTALEDINFWAYRLGKQNGLPIRDAGDEIHLTIHTDASDVGWGAHIDGPVTKSLQGPLPVEVLGQSSTAREVMAIIQGCMALTEELKGHRVQLMMDSYPAFRNLINGGGSVTELNHLIREWWLWCRINKVYPIYKWVPREENQLADDLSKAAAEGYKLKAEEEKKVREWLNEQGEPGLDKCRWKQTMIQYPKFDRVALRLEEMRRTRKPGCIIVPQWPSQPWYNQLKSVSKARKRLKGCMEITKETEGWPHNWAMEAHLVIPELRAERRT